MMRLHVLLLVLLRSCSSFVVPPSGCKSFPKNTISSQRQASSSSAQQQQQQQQAQEIFVVSFDGVVASTYEWRVKQGIQVALKTWPHLQENTMLTQDFTWLENKMMALSHVIKGLPGVSLTCEYALLARLLVEEQELDQGRSVGLNGKYASLYHPNASSNNSRARQQQQPKSSLSRQNGSRPLTVGELSVNWSNGACLADTMVARYNVDGKNPLPILQQNVPTFDTSKNTRPVPNDIVCDALSQCCGKVIISTTHESDLAAVQATLQDTALAKQACPVASSVANALNQGISILPMESPTSTLRRILQHAPPHSTVYVIDSNFKSLETSKILFGDDLPRLGVGLAEWGDSITLSLNFPKWSCTDVSRRNDAEMNIYTNLLEEDVFAELVSARITAA